MRLAKEVIMLMFVGTDTTSYTMSRCMIWLSKHPEWLQALNEEQDRLIAEHGPELTPKVRKSCYSHVPFNQSTCCWGIQPRSGASSLNGRQVIFVWAVKCMHKCLVLLPSTANFDEAKYDKNRHDCNSIDTQHGSFPHVEQETSLGLFC